MSLLLYAYSETEDSARNLRYFVAHGLGLDPTTTYVLIINGFRCSVPDDRRWSRIVRRSNVGHDFGAWASQLPPPGKYRYVIGINSTLAGPFDRNWETELRSLLSDQVGLVGLTINCCQEPRYLSFHRETMIPHVQSMLWCTHRLEVIRPILNLRVSSRDQVILKQELGMSLAITRAGYQLSALAFFGCESSNHPHYGDPWYPKAYHGRTLTSNDVPFFKTSRILADEFFVNQTEKLQYLLM